MSQIHPVTIDSHVLSQVTGASAPPSNPFGDAINRVRRAAGDVATHVRGTLIKAACGSPDPNGSSAHVVGRRANGQPYEETSNSPYASCVASLTGK